jgi:hypothetical protein
MSNLNNTPKIFICRIDTHGVDENSLISILEQDNDFSENEDYYRPDTLELGFENEAERVSKEIFEKNILDVKDDELVGLHQMVSDLFKVEGFIGTSSHYGSYEFEIIETEYEYIVVIATII